MNNSTIFLYGNITEESAYRVAWHLSALDKTTDITFRINSSGGAVSGGKAILSALSEFTGKKTAIIDGKAGSMAAMLLLYFDEVIGNDIGYKDILFHKAAYPEKVRSITAEMQEELDAINTSFERALRKKTAGREGSDAFISKIFSEGRADVSLTMQEAMDLGIITTVKKIEPAAEYPWEIQAVAFADFKEQENPKTETMEITQKDLDAAYAKGKNDEFTRVKAHLQYVEIDLEAAIKGALTPDAQVDAVVMASMQVTALKKARLEAHAAENQKAGAAPEAHSGEESESAEAKAKQAAETARAAELEFIMKL